MLFNKKLLQNEINNFEFPSGERLEKIQKVINGWQTSLKESDLEKTKEKSIQGLFLLKFFNEILGYATQIEGIAEYNFIQHPKTEVDSKEPDGSLGFFSKDKASNITRAVIELKDANTSLDKKQAGRKENYTPVEQGFNYLPKFDRCDWVIVSNFKEIRLYHKSRGEGYYEEFKILDLDRETEFKRFYFLLCKENLIDKNRNALLDRLVKDTSEQQENISKEFYKEFKEIRHNLFNHLIENNSGIERKLLLERTQKLLDRLIFIIFCEYSGSLLPLNIVKDVYNLGIKSRERSDQRVWREFKNLFQDINEGRSDIPPEINKYNGGLFSQDDILDNLTIKDDIWSGIIGLLKYDYESDLNVNILGHIFEQSLSDLEQLKNEIDGIQTDKTKSKRKKDGIYYTPEYITRYIVEQTIGKYLEEHPDKLESIKILDPACGSGAFLNQAHSFLREQYKNRYDEKLLNAGKGQLKVFEHYNLAETDRGILLNNLYGVDLNEESTEITKLALWLKTAKKTEPLQNLDNNIKCGNSLIDSPEIAGNKAFNWNEEFKDITEQGGFDVVIGNPPYVRQELFSNIKPYLEKNYEVYTGVSDLYVYFFERGLKLLKEGGYFAFIVSNKFIKSNYGRKLTQYLQKNYTIVEIIDFGDLQIFEGATTMPCIITIKKEKPTEKQIFNCLELESLDNITNLITEIIKKGFECVIKIDCENWILTSNRKNNLIEKIKDKGISLNELGLNINRGIITGFNEAFIIDTKIKQELCSKDSKSIEIIKPLLRGRDILPYGFNWDNLWLINTHNGYKDIPAINVEQDYSTIFCHLLAYQTNLEKRYDKGKHWSNLRNCAFIEEFKRPKIIYPNMTSIFPFVFDDKGFYTNQKCYILTSNENNSVFLKFLTAYLNSNLSKFLLKMFFPVLLGGTREINEVIFKDFPVPETVKDQQESLAIKAEQMQELNKALNETSKQTLEFIKTKYNLEKISQKLEKFYRLGANQFIEELKKQKVKLTISEEKELMEWFKAESSKLIELEQQINELDKNIDQEVYQLYGLSDEEIQIIEAT